MQASSLASRLNRGLVIRDWAWWQLPPLLRCYVAAVPVLALAVACFGASRAEWRVADLATFLALLCCGTISMASTPRIMYTHPGVTRDFSSIWVLPTAILLPPVYAALMPIPLFAVQRWRVHRGVLHRTVFTAASISLCYALASWVFRSFPPHFAGGTVGSGLHGLTWVIAAVACGLIASRGHSLLIACAVKLSDSEVRIRNIELNRQAVQAAFAELDLGILIAIAIGLSPALFVLALPTVLLVRRFLVYPILISQARIDAKTGMLNVSTWEAEAEAELSRSRRTQSPVALALVDIDHFKSVNDTHGHLVGDRVLKSVAEALMSHLRDYDRAGRFGGEEFVLLLAQTSGSDACRIAERLRRHVAGMAVPIEDRPNAPIVRLTISVGVTAMEQGETRELTDLLAAADSALYHAKETGRNRVAVHAAERARELEVELVGHGVEDVQVDPTGASSGPSMSL
ncbi:MAG TPA: GGDEF domain-containing protein [Trebonia sp.]|jgi:diguanylate cyclase (GGDEF)-like protein